MNNQPIQSSQPSPQTNWTFLLTILLVASLIGLAVFAYQYWQIRQELQAQTEQVENLLEQIDQLEKQIEDLETTEPADETADWQTYRNDEYGFEVRYPGDWEPLDKLQAGINYDKNALFYVLFDDKNNKISSAIFVEIYPLSYVGGILVGTEKQLINISGVDGYKYTKKQSSDAGGRDIIVSTELPKGEKRFKIVYVSDFGEESYEEIYNQILSTFKFIEE